MHFVSIPGFFVSSFMVFAMFLCPTEVKSHAAYQRFMQDRRYQKCSFHPAIPLLYFLATKFEAFAYRCRAHWLLK